MKRFISKLFVLSIVITIILCLLKEKDMTLRQSILKTFYPVIMFLGKLFPSAHAVLENKQQINPTVSFYSLQATTNNGDIISFEAFKGKKVLIINTASDCGFTAQYDELEKLHELYKDSLIMLAFPANDFKQQEKGTDAEIAAFCKKIMALVLI